MDYTRFHDITNIEIMRILISAGADLNTMNHGWTALMKASERGDDTMVDLLIKAEAQINVRNSHHRSALMVSAEKGYTKIVKLLIEAGADPDTKDRYGETVLLHVATRGYTEIAKVLIEAGADPNLRAKYFGTPLFSAVQKNYTEIVKLLIEAGADPNIHDNKEISTPLELAASNRNPEIVLALLRAGANIGREHIYRWMDFWVVPNDYNHSSDYYVIPDGDYNILLHEVERDLRIEIAKLFISGGADVNKKNSSGWAALTYATYYGDIEIVKLLIEKGADINSTDSSGLTALQYALKKLRTEHNGLYMSPEVDISIMTEIIKVLIAAGADIISG